MLTPHIMPEELTSHIRFDADSCTLNLLDQRLLPTKEEIVSCQTVDEVISALKNMVVRGAPAIGVTAAFGCVLAAKELSAASGNWQARLAETLDRLSNARPTAVNLRFAVEQMRAVWQKEAPGEVSQLLKLWLKEAYRLQAEDIDICKRIGLHGATLIKDGDCILTHCNAGALATAGYGTALGVVRAAYAAGKNISVIADETRPFLQGARLTAWELAREGIPVTVACDNAACLLMQKGKVQCVVVGADRIAANGDTANKIGTCGVSLLAQHFHIPFYVAAPLSTVDLSLQNGSAIPIEERDAKEVSQFQGQPITPEKVPVYNYAFDVTPADAITALITEVGVLRPPFSQALAAAFGEKKRS